MSLNFATATLTDLIDNASEFFQAVDLFRKTAGAAGSPVSPETLDEISRMSEVMIRLLGDEKAGIQHRIRMRAIRKVVDNTFASMTSRSTGGTGSAIALNSPVK